MNKNVFLECNVYYVVDLQFINEKYKLILF